MTKVRISGFTVGSVVDGLGIRSVVYFQGCPRNCPGCHNLDTHDFNGGTEMTVKELAVKILESVTPLTKGITFSGGDPVAQPEALLETIQIIKRENPRLDIWVYTGYLFEEIKNLPFLPFIEVLVDGPFILKEKDLALAFRGSANQRVINVTQSLKEEKVILLPLPTEKEK